MYTHNKALRVVETAVRWLLHDKTKSFVTEGGGFGFRREDGDWSISFTNLDADHLPNTFLLEIWLRQRKVFSILGPHTTRLKFRGSDWVEKLPVNGQQSQSSPADGESTNTLQADTEPNANAGETIPIRGDVQDCTKRRRKRSEWCPGLPKKTSVRMEKVGRPLG